MYCCSSFLVFLKHTFSLEQEPEPAKKKPEPVKNGPAPQHCSWCQVKRRKLNVLEVNTFGYKTDLFEHEKQECTRRTVLRSFYIPVR